MKKNISILLLFCGIVLLQFSCTPKLHIETTRPAKVAISPDQWEVIVINRFNPQLLPQEDKKVVEVMTQGAREAFQGAVDAILDDSTYLLVHADTAAFPAASKGGKLSAEQLKEIRLQHPHHLLLTLNHFDVYMGIEQGGVEGEYGFIAQMPYIRLFTQAHWTLYNNSGTQLDEITIEANDIFQSGMAFLGAIPSITKAAPAIHHLSWYTGYDYWMRLSPQPDSYERPYYSNKKLGEAAAAMRAEDWETAISLLEPIARSEDRIATKAAYNLAIVYEALSMFDEAKYWARQAAEKNNRFALMLLHELENY